MQEHVNAAADISDGLLADSMHIAKASGLGAEIDLNAVVFSSEVQTSIEKGDLTYEHALKGGDDDELILAVSSVKADLVVSFLKKSSLNPQVIGCFLSGFLNLNLKGFESYHIDLESLGWTHF